MKDRSLRDYQQEMIARVQEAWRHHRSVMVQMPTGTGKTHVLASIVADFPGKVLIVAHRVELVEQIRETVGRFYHSELINHHSELQISSIQTVSRRIDVFDFHPDLVIVDEAHHALAKTYRILWEKWPEAKFLGLTATPCRMNRAGFTDLFDCLLSSWSIAEFIERGVLSVFDYVSIRPDSEDQRLIDSLVKRGADGDYQVKEMNEVLNKRPPIERLYRSFSHFACGQKGIVYAISIEHARQIAAYYSQMGVKAAAIDSKTPLEERKRLVGEFKRGELRVLVNVDVFSEGFDCPDVEFVQMARPTLSLAKYLQQVGRGLRKSEGKRACVLIDNVGLYRVFGLPVVDRDWESMFRGEIPGRGLRVPVPSDDMACAIRKPLEGGIDADMELVVSHELLLSQLGELSAHSDKKEGILRAWQDKHSGLWGLRCGRNRVGEARYVRVFDVKKDWAAVRFEDHACGLVDVSGKVVWKQRGYESMKFGRNHFLKVHTSNGMEHYLDLYSLRMYDSKPKVRRYGKVEVLKVRDRYYSRTRDVYISSGDFESILFVDKGFYLSVFENPERYFCLLPGNYECFYRFRRMLADKSIVVEDSMGHLFHVSEGMEKEPIHNFNSVGRLEERVRKRLEAEHEARRQKTLDDYQRAVPFCIGSKWGIKVGDRLTVPPVYRMIKPPVGKFCVVEKNYGQWGLIAVDGSVLIEPVYPEITIGDDGVVMVTSVTGKRRIYNIKV